jgi:hypothetical protein
VSSGIATWQSEEESEPVDEDVSPGHAMQLVAVLVLSARYFPAGHSMQDPVSLVVVHARATFLPAGHPVQSLQTLFVDTVGDIVS